LIFRLRSVSLHFVAHVAKRNDVGFGRSSLGFAAEKLVRGESAARAVFLDGSDDFGKVEAERGSQSFDDVGVENALVFFGAEICVCSDKLAELRNVEIKEENY